MKKVLKTLAVLILASTGILAIFTKIISKVVGDEFELGLDFDNEEV